VKFNQHLAEFFAFDLLVTPGNSLSKFWPLSPLAPESTGPKGNRLDLN
jgi:hypothetical protein